MLICQKARNLHLTCSTCYFFMIYENLTWFKSIYVDSNVPVALYQKQCFLSHDTTFEYFSGLWAGQCFWSPETSTMNVSGHQKHVSGHQKHSPWMFLVTRNIHHHQTHSNISWPKWHTEHLNQFKSIYLHLGWIYKADLN